MRDLYHSLYYDPFDIYWCALYIAITWYKQITPEQALKQMRNKIHLSPPVQLTPELLSIIKHDLDRRKCKHYHKTWDYIEKKYRVSRYDVIQALYFERSCV